MSAVYAIQNKVNGAAYIGSSVDLDVRIKTHFRSLKRGNHFCDYLQRAWNKYGEASFNVKVAYEAKDLNEVRSVEQELLDFVFPDGVYNSKSSAIGMPAGDSHPSKQQGWHMKSILRNLDSEERKRRYGKAKGIKRTNLENYRSGAAKRLADPEFRNKLSKACKGKRKIVTCPKCGLSGGGGNMRRYHFNRCRHESKPSLY